MAKVTRLPAAAGAGLSPLLSHHRASASHGAVRVRPPTAGTQAPRTSPRGSLMCTPGSDCGSEVQTRKKGWRCGLSKHRGSGSAGVVTKEPPPPQSVHRRLEGGGLGTIAMPREPQWVPSLHSGNLKVSPVPENVAGHPSTDDSTLSCVLPLTCNLGSPALPTLPPRPGPRQSHELSRVQISRICLPLPGGLADPASSPPPAFWRPTWCSP